MDRFLPSDFEPLYAEDGSGFIIGGDPESAADLAGLTRLEASVIVKGDVRSQVIYEPGDRAWAPRWRETLRRRLQEQPVRDLAPRQLIPSAGKA